ncbi:MAG: ribosome silencing factor [Ignavibacteria bacterium]|nr:ribosome silencing factor [Ignavibacteria bacterium]
MTPKTLAKKIAQFALTKKASNIILMDLRKVTDMTDFFVVCSADSDVQVKAIADAVIDETEKLGVPTWHREGLTQRQWVLLDYVDVVVHIFHKEVRKYYGLEKLWGDAPTEVMEEKTNGAPRKAIRKKRSTVKR